MSIVLINPNLIVQRNDPFTTGIVYMPFNLAYLASSLRENGFSIQVIDAFAERPRQAQRDGEFTWYGLSINEVVARVPASVQVAFIYAINLTNHNATIAITRELKQVFPDLPVIILENTQAVTAYALQFVMDEFFNVGADYVLTGESELRAVQLLTLIAGNADVDELREIDGLGSPNFYTPPASFISELDSLPFPAWDLFPIKNYWDLHFSHGPLSSARYLPILTSRGCPYPCRFCVVPATNQQKWRSRSAENVVDEMEHFMGEFGVREFHFEDLDPTISDQRIRDICNEILARDLNIIWKIASGTKVETIRNEETIDLMAKAGCRYISISPETGSARVLKLMKKPFDLDHAVRLVKRMDQVGIRSQACFVLGFPGEKEQDLEMTWNLVHDLTRKGVDEIALFMITPVPGSSIYEEFQGYQSLSQLNFTPTWRMDYKQLNRFRLRLYGAFLWWKLRYHPLKVLRQAINFLRRRFETKMEMIPYRALVLKRLDRKKN
ncbi:MAG: B12-binding domain-containing radical SAM protein [Chloroflexi bacterium]|nr:B12-binding domain-containing radical SAM protein [Chloroflexota bacterium]